MSLRHLRGCAGARHRPPAWVLWAWLIVVAVRGLIPAGFMPGRAGLEVCPGGMDPAMAQMVHAHHAHYAEEHRAPAQRGDHSESCVFASSAGGFAPLSTAPSANLPPILAQLLRISAPICAFLPTIVRAQSPRAPPTLS